LGGSNGIFLAGEFTESVSFRCSSSLGNNRTIIGIFIVVVVGIVVGGNDGLFANEGTLPESDVERGSETDWENW